LIFEKTKRPTGGRIEEKKKETSDVGKNSKHHKQCREDSSDRLPQSVELEQDKAKRNWKTATINMRLGDKKDQSGRRF